MKSLKLGFKLVMLNLIAAEGIIMKHLNNIKFETITLIVFASILIVISLLAHTEFFNLDLRFALRGFSILSLWQVGSGSIS